MKSSILVIFACVVAFAAGQSETTLNTEPSDTTFSEPTSSDGPTTTGDIITDSGFSESPSPEVSFSEGSTIPDETSLNTDIDTENDIIIKLTTEPDEETTTDGTGSSTVYDDDTTISSTTLDGQGISETNKSLCHTDPCRNGGTCEDDASAPFFSCECPAGYHGLRCETTDLCVYDGNGTACKSGFCAFSADGLTSFCDCFVGYYWDNVTSECRVKTTVCDSSPCENGGTCNLLSDSKYNCTCEEGFSGSACEITDRCVEDEDCGYGLCLLSADKKTRTCDCDYGFYLEEKSYTCVAMKTPCDSNPCENGGVCNSFGDQYNCTCDAGFSGNTCEVTDWCEADGDCGHGACVFEEAAKTRSCRCDDGFYLEKMNHTCKKISNICQTNPCLHDGICTVISADDFNCTCSEGYTGKTCDVRDMCVMDGGNAYCGQGSCVTNYQLGVYYCTCPDQEYFHYAERKCVEVDLCPLVQCKSNEKCLLGVCVCQENYKWNNVTVAKCEPNFCASDPCPIPDMTCKEGTDGMNYKCSCEEGYAFNGTHCNEALCVFPQLNPCTQLCTVTESGYECSCEEGFQLREDNKTCELIGNDTCTNKTCDKGSCVLKSDLEVCICPPGYTEVDGKCTDICSAAMFAPGLCPTNECEMTADGGFRCKCEGKFALSEDKTTCVVRNMCRENEVGWLKCKEKNAACEQNWNLPEGFECHCASGKVKAEDGICRDLCNIVSNQRTCSMKGATCDTDKSGKLMCKCPPYFQANQKDGKCSKPADVSYLITLPLDLSTYTIGNRVQRSLDSSINYEKISRDVRMTIKEMFVGFTRANILYCNSTSGFILCKIEFQFAIEHETQLRRLETDDICLSSGNSKKCLLPPALVLVKERISRDVVIEPTDPCDEYIKEEICGSETSCTSSLRNRSFNCSCKPGFSMRKRNYPFGNDRSFVESCRDIDECVEDYPCLSNSDCFNTIGSFVCKCKVGFRSVKDSSGSSVEGCVEICNPNPCTHGLCSRRGDHQFDCKCDAGYRGAFCDLRDENFKRARNNTIIVGVVLGGILLITFILFAVCVSRLRKRKCLENPGHMLYNSTEMKERGRINNAFQRE